MYCVCIKVVITVKSQCQANFFDLHVLHFFYVILFSLLLKGFYLEMLASTKYGEKCTYISIF